MKKILVVDDREEIIELLEMTLSRSNVEVLSARSANDAMEVVLVQKPDLIIMDVMMPGEINGLEATRIIKSDPKTKHCKVIMLSGMGDDFGREESLQAGALDYFRKPFSPLQLIGRVDELLKE